MSASVLQSIRTVFDDRFPHAMTAALVARVLIGTGINLRMVEEGIIALLSTGAIHKYYGISPSGRPVYRGTGKSGGA